MCAKRCKERSHSETEEEEGGGEICIQMFFFCFRFFFNMEGGGFSWGDVFLGHNTE